MLIIDSWRRTMRSTLAASLMGIGGIFVSFSAVVVVLALLAGRTDPYHRLAGRGGMATEAFVAGAVLLVLGFALSRLGRKTAEE
jgi:small-conductance mechanosensitive channel